MKYPNGHKQPSVWAAGVSLQAAVKVEPIKSANQVRHLNSELMWVGQVLPGNTSHLDFFGQVQSEA